MILFGLFELLRFAVYPEYCGRGLNFLICSGSFSKMIQCENGSIRLVMY